MVPFHEHVRILHLSARARLEAYSRLFRFTTEEDINPKDFAEKTGMAIMSVNSMIQHAKLNTKLYEEMIELGYSDDAFPVWWYSPGREGTEAKTVGQGGTTAKEGEQIEGRRTETEEGEGYEPTPPDTPAPKEGRPALPAPPLRCATVRARPTFSDILRLLRCGGVPAQGSCDYGDYAWTVDAYAGAGRWQDRVDLRA